MKNILLALLVLLSSFYTGAQQAKDSTAIKKVLEKEAATWRSGDVKAHADCWLVQPYGRILYPQPMAIVMMWPRKMW